MTTGRKPNCLTVTLNSSLPLLYFTWPYRCTVWEHMQKMRDRTKGCLTTSYCTNPTGSQQALLLEKWHLCVNMGVYYSASPWEEYKYLIWSVNTFICPKSFFFFCLIGQDLPKHFEGIVLEVDIVLAFVNILCYFGRLFFQAQFHTESNLLYHQQSCLGRHTPKCTIATTRHEYP